MTFPNEIFEALGLDVDVDPRTLTNIDKILGLLLSLHRKVDDLMTNQSTFDADLNTLVTALTSLETAYTSLAAKAADAGVDLTAEDTEVKAALATLNSILNPPAAATPTRDSAGKVLYQDNGATDTTGWTLSTLKDTADGSALYTFDADVPGGPPTGASAVWVVFAGTAA